MISLLIGGSVSVLIGGVGMYRCLVTMLSKFISRLYCLPVESSSLPGGIKFSFRYLHRYRHSSPASYCFFFFSPATLMHQRCLKIQKETLAVLRLCPWEVDCVTMLTTRKTFQSYSVPCTHLKLTSPGGITF